MTCHERRSLVCYFAFAQEVFEKLSMHGGKNYNVSSTECNVAYVPCTERLAMRMWNRLCKFTF